MSETWYFNEKLISLPSTFSVNFVSNGMSYNTITYSTRPEFFNVIYRGDSTGNNVYFYDSSSTESGSWYNDAYRTIVLEEPATGYLLTWLEANAVKQSSQLSLDLTTLSGWSSLSSGTYDVYVKSKGKDVPSDASDSVEVEKQGSTMPVKGQIITMNLDGTARQYRVVKINGTQAEVVCMETVANVAFNDNISCFLPGTQITLSDYTTKNIEDITYDDELLVWDFDEGTYGTAKPCWLTKSGLHNDHYYQLTFDDGTVLKTTGLNSNHKVYNVDEHFFKGVDKTEIGDRIYAQSGIRTVTNKEYIEQDVEYYNIITSKKIDCFAEGILTSDRYGNLYTIDDNMKWIKDGREVRPYSEFEAVGISQYWYDNLRLGETTDTLEKVRDYIDKCESQMRPIEEE